MNTVVETKFCTGCQRNKPLDGGINRATRGITRWICKSCLTRKNESIYKSQKNMVRAQFAMEEK